MLRTSLQAVCRRLSPPNLGVVAHYRSNKNMPTSSVVPLSDLLLYAVSSWNKKTSPPPLVGLVSKTEKIKKNICTMGPVLCAFRRLRKTNCHSLRSLVRLSANQPSTGTPILNYLRFRFFIFFFSLRLTKNFLLSC